MKYFLLLSFLILNQCLFAQREIRFADSLTLNSQRSWIQVDGSSFTSIGDDCNFGMEMTFYEKDNKVEVLECQEGEWKSFKYTFEVSSEVGEHFIRFYEKKTVFPFFTKKTEVDDFRIEVQMISDSLRNFSTELNYFSLKDKTTRTLRSKR